MTDFACQREEMVERQLRARGIADPAVLDAFRSVPREAFVADADRDMAYRDHPLPIACGQTISQPYVVAVALEAASIGPDDKVLEVGAGSGYVASLLGRIARSVVAVERHAQLASSARERMERMGLTNVRIVEGDGTLGVTGESPFDVIIASATAGHIPQAWLDQLNPGGRLVMPVGAASGTQELIKLVKAADNGLHVERLGAVRFVPLVGGEGPAPFDPRRTES